MIYSFWRSIIKIYTYSYHQLSCDVDLTINSKYRSYHLIHDTSLIYQSSVVSYPGVSTKSRTADEKKSIIENS